MYELLLDVPITDNRTVTQSPFIEVGRNVMWSTLVKLLGNNETADKSTSWP